MTPLQLATQEFSGKKILIFGLGLLGGGEGDVRFFNKIGSHVRVTDIKTEFQLESTIQNLKDLPIKMTLGTHAREDIEWADVIIRNPSVPQDHEMLVYAKQLNKQIAMRTSLFACLSQIKIVGVTGTRGKTTTTMLIYELAGKLSKQKVILGGNVAGISDLELLDQIDDPSNTLAILELSSWQLQGFADESISPHIGVITNLYPDHLNRYHSLEEYYEDKHAIIKFQHKADHAVLNDAEPIFHGWSNTTESQVHWFRESDLNKEILAIPGIHNRYNAAAALKVADVLGFDHEKSLEVIRSFKGVPYRMETITTKHGITYINDTTSTTPIATITALLSLAKKPILILGGSDKRLPMDDLVSAVNTHAKTIILLPGDGTNRILPHLNQTLVYQQASSMEEAVTVAAKIAQNEDVVLLSPGFTSFGLFNNEFHRGDEFNRCVKNLP